MISLKPRANFDFWTGQPIVVLPKSAVLMCIVDDGASANYFWSYKK